MTDTLIQTVAANIRTIREQRGLSQRALGRLIGVSSAAVNGWENGDGITAVNLVAVADALGVSVTRLLGRDNSEAFWDGYATGWDACRARMTTATEPVSVAAAEAGAT